MSLEAPAFSKEFLSAEDNVQSRVILMHSLPRFGHNANFAKLVSSNQEEQVDYVVGILAAAFFILSMFIFWFAAIISCKCVGKRRIGFLSGRMHLQPDKKGRFRPPMYLWKLRYTFIFLGCAMVGCALILAMPATKSVINASKSSQKIHREVKDLTDQGLLIVADLSRVKKNINALDVRAVLQVEKLCPDYKTFLSSDEALNDSLQLINDEFDDFNELLEGFDFESVRNGIDFVNAGIRQIDTAATVAQDNDWMVKMYVLVLAVMVVFMMLAASEILDKDARINPALQMMVNIFIFPVFVVCVFLAVAASVLLAVMGTANSDFCAAGPEVTVSNILFELGLRRGSMIYDTFEYYQTECKTRDPITLLYKYEERLQSGITSASNLLDQFNEIGLEEMNEKCGANMRPLVEVVGILRDNLGILLGALRSTFEASSCSRVSPIYKQTFNANACEESACGLTLMFMVTTTLAAIGMVMIMLRSAMYPYKSVKRNPYLDQDEKISEYDEYKSYVGYMSEFVNIWKTKDGDDSSEPTATWSGSIESKSEEEKPLSPTTPGISWENHILRPSSLLLSPESNNGEVGHNTKTPRVRPSSLMFSPPNRASGKNYFDVYSPLSASSSNISQTSQSISYARNDEEQPLSPETSSIVWDNDWEDRANKRVAVSSPLSLGSNEGRMSLSPLPDGINDDEQPLSPGTLDVIKLMKDASAATPVSVVSKDSIPSLTSGTNEGKMEPDPNATSSKEVADSLLAMGFMGAVLGMPAPDALRKKQKKNVNLWDDDDKSSDEIPSMGLDDDMASTDSTSEDNVSNSEIDEKVVEDGLLQSPTSRSNSNMELHSEDTDNTNNEDETRLSPESSLGGSASSRLSSIRARFTPSLKSLSIPHDQDEVEELMTPQARDDQEAVSDERSIPKRFNVMRFGTPDFLSPLRRGARDYKKID